MSVSCLLQDNNSGCHSLVKQPGYDLSKKIFTEAALATVLSPVYHQEWEVPAKGREER
jgi:hypothetical protein